MKLSDVVEETYTALSSNKARSGLTMLGIIIGISSVIAMVAIGQGAQGTIEENIQSIGSNLIMVMPGAQKSSGSQVRAARGSAKTLTTEDAEAIANEVDNVKAVAPETSGTYQLVVSGSNTRASVLGTNADYLSVKNVEMEVGDFLTAQNLKSLSKVAVLGSTVRDDLFGEGVDPTGEKVRINGMQFKIIGVTAAKGGNGFGSQDQMVFIPLTTAQKLLVGDEYLSTIDVQAETSEAMTQIQDDITALLLDRHDLANADSADFSIMNQADIVETASSVTGTFTLLLAAIAGISLIVGGIGIMNMMLTTVTERTKEIGLRKAIGATAADINNQFLIEAIMLTFVGGAIGVVLGWLISWGVDFFDVTATSVSLKSVLLAFGVSAAIGIVFGYYPAKRASKLNPIDALRYE